MFVSGSTFRSAVTGAVAAGAIAGSVLCGGISVASADVTPGCTAADLAVASGTVGTAMGDYLFSHPNVNDFFTSLRGLPNEEIRGRVQDYMDANPAVEAEVNGIRQPVTDLRSRCDAPAPAMDS
jgi:hemophore-related protein